jgi:uncharacterized membrane protein YoaK (UPF0700 family)
VTLTEGRSLTERLYSTPPGTMHLWLMLLLTFTTGVNDAVGYLALDKVFTGNMTGNVVILGMALAGGADLPVVGPALALAGFMVGAAAGGRLLKRADRGWSGRTTLLLGAVAFLVLALAAVLFVAGSAPGQPLAVTVTTAAALAMGAQAVTARHIAVKDVTTVVVTSTITGLAADSRLGAGKAEGTGRRLAAVVVILAGAAAGAGLLRAHIAVPLLLAGVLIAAAAAVGAWHARVSAPAEDGAVALSA